MKAKYLSAELLSNAKFAGAGMINRVPLNPNDTIGSSGRTYKTLRDLKNDPHVWSCIQSRKSGVCGSSYELIPGRATQEMIDIIASWLENIDFEQLKSDILECLFFGFQPIELFWEDSSSLMLPTRFVSRQQEWFVYDQNSELKLRRYGVLDGEEIPHGKIICPRYEASGDNPYGTALLGKCYWPVTFKNGGIRFWTSYIERFASPVLIGKYTRGATQAETDKLADALASMNQDSVIVAPHDIDIEFANTNKAGSADIYLELIKHCNSEISKALLSQTLTTELYSGSYAASQTHYYVKQELAKRDIKLLESTLNSIFRLIGEINFGSKDCPSIRLIVEEIGDGSI